MSFQWSKDTLNHYQQKKLYNQSIRYIVKGYHRRAEANLLKLLKLDSTNIDYNYELGLLYYFDLFQTEKSLKYFERIKRLMKNNEYPEIYFYLGQAYQFIGEFDKAIEAYNNFKPYIPKKEKLLAEDVLKFIEECNNGKKLQVDTKIRIRNLGNRINTMYAEYVPVSINNDSLLLFTARRPKVMSTHYGFESNFYYENVYVSVKKEDKYSFALLSNKYDAFKILGENKRWHNAIVSSVNNDKTLIIYKRNKLWTSENIDGIWQKPKKVSKIINFSFYQPHASITEAGDKIYFSSWSKKGFGGIDIYYSEKDQNGHWTKAKNIGPEINTKYDEDSPEISKDGKTLYFSSKGHDNIGGYDIFKSEYIDGKWTKPVNMGMPINSPGDDIFFKFNNSGNIVYFSSHRKEGFGNMDIYEILFGPQFNNCKNINFVDNTNKVIDIITNDTIYAGMTANLKSVILNTDSFQFVKSFWKVGNIVKEGSMDFSYTFDSAGAYSIFQEIELMNPVTKESDAYCYEKTIHVIEEKLLADNNQDTSFTTETNIITETNTDTDNTNLQGNNISSSNPLSLGKIYFDFDQYIINKKAEESIKDIYKLLSENKSYKIKIVGHTDSWGDDYYNQLLSVKRANSVKEYLVNMGIDPSRITEVEGKGEKELVNNCKDGIPCSIEDHKLNRRVEIFVY
ncbi:MAG: hypothetical protein Kow0068_20220 [Marinilabiliales bacterium]